MKNYKEVGETEREEVSGENKKRGGGNQQQSTEMWG